MGVGDIQYKLCSNLQSDLISLISRYLHYIVAYKTLSTLKLLFEKKRKESYYSQSSRKRTPSGRDKNVRNWSWPLTRMVLVSGH